MIGREEETLKILTKISNEEHARHLLADIKTSLQNDQLNAHQKLNYRDGNVRFILIPGCMIAMLQQVTGVNVMMYYAPIVLKDVTGSARRPCSRDNLDRRDSAYRFHYWRNDYG